MSLRFLPTKLKTSMEFEGKAPYIFSYTLRIKFLAWLLPTHFEEILTWQGNILLNDRKLFASRDGGAPEPHIPIACSSILIVLTKSEQSNSNLRKFD